MNATVTVTTLLYLAVTAGLGYLGFKQTTSAKDYLLAGRKVHPVIMAISYGSTFISTAAIVGFGGAAAVFGLGILWLTVLNIFLGIFIAFVVFGKRTRAMGHKLDAHTFPEFIGRRYDSKFLQVAAAALIFVGMPLYAGAVMLGGVSFLTVALGLSQNMALLTIVVIVGLYVMMGGMKGVLYTDAFQGGIMVLGMIVLLWFAYRGLGGVGRALGDVVDRGHHGLHRTSTQTIPARQRGTSSRMPAGARGTARPPRRRSSLNQAVCESNYPEPPTSLSTGGPQRSIRTTVRHALLRLILGDLWEGPPSCGSPNRAAP